MQQEIRGISFPFRIGGRGGVVVSGRRMNEELHIKDNLKQLFTTDIGERVMSPSYGMQNLDIFFNDLNETTKSMAEYKIRETVETWEPRIIVTHVDIHEEVSAGTKKHIVTLYFRIANSGEEDTFSISI